MAYEVDPELPGTFDPDDIARRDFALSRRGFDPGEVRAFLAAVADEQRLLRQHALGVDLQVADLLGRLDDAEDRREAAEARAAVLERELADGRAEAALRAAADEAELRSSLDALASARAEVTALEQRLASADPMAPGTLAALVADVLPASDDAESVGAETARVLAAAHEAADAMRARAVADAGRIEAAARELAQRVTRDAEVEAAAVLDAARSEAAEVVATASAEARAERQRLAVTAEGMAAEASAARRELLDELTARRRRLRHQVEQLQAARDRLLEVLSAAAATLDAVRVDVDGALPAAREAATSVPEPDLGEVAGEVEAAVPAPVERRPVDDGGPRSDPPGNPGSALFDRLRDQAGGGRGEDPTSRQVTRRLKKVLTDEQNALLDRVCRSRRLPAVAVVLPDVERRRRALLDAAAPLGAEGAAAVVDRLADPLGTRVEAALTSAADRDDAARALRAVYREWRDERVAAAVLAAPRATPAGDETSRP